MTAYESAVFDELCQKLANGAKLTGLEQARYNFLDAQARQEWESKPQPFMYGGDYADVF
jgi:hypothetical protein